MTAQPVRPPRNRRIAVLLSGGGRTLMNILDRIREDRLDAEVALVVASRECVGAQRARDAGLPVRVISGVIPADRLRELLADADVSLVALAGYLQRVDIPHEWAGRVLNIHPALLPAHGGRGMYGERVHRAVLDSGADQSGCTVHLCDGAYDTGPILEQCACAVLPDDDVNALADRVFQLECDLYPRVIGKRLNAIGRGDA
ncbi:MAG: phosphoribosylglycinamide formyltransferase [Phycisphaerales bacterium]